MSICRLFDIRQQTLVGRDEAARELGQSHPNFRQPYNTLIASLGQVGDIDGAHAVLTNGLARFGEAFRVLMLLPLSELRELRPEDSDHLIDGFRKAGLA